MSEKKRRDKRAQKEYKKNYKNAKERLAEKWEGPIRDYFVRLFGKFRFRNEAQFLRFAKWLIFIVLIVVEGMMILNAAERFQGEWGSTRLLIILSLVGALTASEALKLFVLKDNKTRFFFYVLDAIVACGCIFFIDGTYPLLLYMLVLTQYYIGAEKMTLSAWLIGSSMPIYAVCYGLQTVSQGEGIKPLLVLRNAIGPVIALSIHFLAVHIALAFYRQYLKLDRTLRELDESKQELEKAYAVVAEVTALEERQRIATDIHDTAGHSITTVIMQTESAKRILESNPDEAKAKIVAANLQAKHALEELRASVHLLSGLTEKQTLKDDLLSVLHESMDGTGLNIRSEIEDISVSEAKHRFLCNTLKEGISNGLRHGGATAFWFELKREKDMLRFLLSDNGKGIDGAPQEGFGLSTMRQRAKSLGGEVTLSSEIDEGFEISIVLPMDAEEGKNV